jgi:hypothetical protein
MKSKEDECSVKLYVIVDSAFDPYADTLKEDKKISIIRSIRTRNGDGGTGFVDGDIDRDFMEGGKSTGRDTMNIYNSLYFSEMKGGWFSASYGPYRRFIGGDSEYDKLLSVNRRLSAHLSVFSESVALTESIRWLQSLQFERLELGEESKVASVLDKIIGFINGSGILPNGMIFERITSKAIYLSDERGFEVNIEDISDGFRSLLSLSLDLIRQLLISYYIESIFAQSSALVIVPGVVLIDEVDAHLHPTWQQRIGFWFREHFPNMQFIVTTHSPLICQAAEKGTIFKLPTPGTDEAGHFIEGAERNRLLYGNILEAYSTEAFAAGEERVTRSEAGQKRLQRLGELNIKEISEGLTDEEIEEQVRLRAALPTSATTLNP